MPNVALELTNALKQRYVVEREVGRGAMATVYLAREVQHNRQVALKVLAPELAHSLAAERFLREIRTAATLTHPNILPVHDSGRAAGLLYYVTPYVSGQTLRACLQQAGHLPLADALAIARQIADALAYAHEQGVVHRDIKPENILLTSGHQVWVADFGLAHALSGGADTRLTATGVSIGSPLYMSPEQAAGSARIDGRADIYALGCVLYEMLTGAPPFMGDDIASVLAKHLTMPPPRASQSTKDVPAHVDATIDKALEKSPARRFANARQFADALSPMPRASRMFRPRNLAVAMGLFFTAILGMLLFELPSRAVSLAGGLPSLSRATLDTTRYLVLPFAATGDAGVEAQQRMHDALRRWRPIEVVDLLNVQEAVRQDGSEVSAGEARRIARAYGAGRVVSGSITRSAGRYRVAAVLHDANRRNRVIDRATIPQENPAVSLDSLFAMLADSLLFDDRGMNPRTAAPVGTRSRPAREAFRAGQLALLDWEVERADSLFTAAIRHDPDYAQAHLWLAEVRGWLSDAPAQWQLLTERAVAGKAVLTPKEQRLSEALHALATSQFGQACAIYDSLAAADPHDFYAVYGTADCRRRDRMVLPAPDSESGWRFRSNFYRAILGYQRAFQLWPSTHKAYSANSFDRVRQLVFTRTARLISGQSREEGRFLAAAAVRGDSLIFIPYPASVVQTANVRTSTEAVARLRRIFYDIARDWKAAYPESPVALEAMALASDLRGDPDAITLVAKARGLASDERYRAHLGALQVIIWLKRALPHDRAGVRAAALLADSLVEANAAESNWSEFAPAIGFVAGRPDYAARAARAAVSASEDADLPYQVRADAEALLAYASIGVRPDSLRVLEGRVHERVARVDSADRRTAFESALLRPVTMAFSAVRRLGTLKSADVGGDHLLIGQEALARGDGQTARATILAQLSNRQKKNPADLQFDAIYPEAWLLYAAGAPQLAARWLDPTLTALSEQDPVAFADFARMAGLLRSIELRARLAHALGDRAEARLWAEALLSLWDDADPVLQPVAAVMRTYAGKRRP